MPSDTSPESKYPPLQKPDFKPNIPPFLTEEASEQDRFIIEQISILGQYVKWSVDTQMQVHSQVRTTNGRLIKAEHDIELAKSDLDSLKTQAAAVSPFFKPLSMFSGLWEYRWFKWTFSLGVFGIFGLLYPYYMGHPYQVLWAALKKWAGAE